MFLSQIQNARLLFPIFFVMNISSFFFSFFPFLILINLYQHAHTFVSLFILSLFLTAHILLLSLIFFPHYIFTCSHLSTLVLTCSLSFTLVLAYSFLSPLILTYSPSSPLFTSTPRRTAAVPTSPWSSPSTPRSLCGSPRRWRRTRRHT